jgi:hypothetical protein
MMLRCSTCKQHKPAEEFNKNRSTKTGYHNQCKICQRMWKPSPEKLKIAKERTRIWSRFRVTGFTEEDFQQKLNEQEKRCAICGTDNPGNMGWQADHCHETLIKRGVLCHLCNKGLGHFKDNIELLLKAIKYLERYHKEPSNPIRKANDQTILVD